MSFAKWRPKTKGETVIVLGFIACGLGELGHTVFSSTNGVHIDTTLEWLCRLFRDTGLTVALVGMVVFGLHSLRKEGFSYKMTLVALVGFSFIVALAYVSFTASSITDDITEDMANVTKQIERLKIRAGDEGIPIEDRVRYSEAYAKIMYSEEGVTVAKLNIDGTTTMFEPTEEDMKMREEMQAGKLTMQWLRDSFWRSGVYWAVMSVVGLLLGVLPFKRVNV